MTGPGHYSKAEELLEHGEMDGQEPELVSDDIARAQVHATLALADFFRAWTEAAVR